MLGKTDAFLGIDPGLTGAMVVVHAPTNTVLSSNIIPTLVVQRNCKQKRILDIPKLVLTARDLASQYPDLVAFLELVGANPMHGRRQGTSSMFNFGCTNGAIEAAVVAAGIPYSKITPAAWKSALGCSKDKDQTLERASSLIPDGKAFWTPKRGVRTKESCYGIAEAALIAYYGIQNRVPDRLKQAA
jgi:hypothetical protein